MTRHQVGVKFIHSHIHKTGARIAQWYSGLSHSGKNRLAVFENRVQRRIFGPKRDEVMKPGENLHEELYNLYCSPDIIRVVSNQGKLDGHGM
jgi:hypothetical protein